MLGFGLHVHLYQQVLIAHGPSSGQWTSGGLIAAPHEDTSNKYGLKLFIVQKPLAATLWRSAGKREINVAICSLWGFSIVNATTMAQQGACAEAELSSELMIYGIGL